MFNFQSNEKRRSLTLKSRWVWILVAGMLAGVATYLGTLWLPDEYTSESILLAQPLEGTNKYLDQLKGDEIGAHLVLSLKRSLTDEQLDQVMQEANLYSEIRVKQGSQVALLSMRKDISVTATDGMAVRLTYSALDPHTAQGVLKSLVALISVDSGKADADVSLEREILQVQEKLLESGRRLQGFNTQFGSSQRDQRSLTLGELKQWMQRLQSNVEAINQLEAVKQAKQKNPTEGQVGVPVDGTSKLVQNSEISEGNGSESKENTSLATANSESRSEIDQLDAQIEQRKKEQAVLRKSLVSYQAKLGTTSGLEKTQKELYSDYEATRLKFHELLARKAESEKSDNSNPAQTPIRFRTLTAPNLPTRPAFPNRPLLALAGVALGLFVGAALAALTRGKQKPLVSSEDIVKMTGLPILARIPIISAAPKGE